MPAGSRRSVPRPLLPLLAAAILACSGRDLVAPDASMSPFETATVISDGQTGGNAHFFFLPPMVKAPTVGGVFDAGRAPMVTITRGATLVAELPAALDTDGEQYKAVWHTNQSALDLGAIYRITVRVNGHVLGFADVDVVANGAQLKNVNTGEYIGLVDGRSLPIKFRVEVGAVPTGWRQLAAMQPDRRGLSAIAHHAAGQEIFAGVMIDYAPGALWRFDLTTDTWSRLRADAWPIGKYRKLVHDPVNRRLLTYWDGLGRVYQIPDTGGTWMPIGNSPNSEEFYEGFGFWDPVSMRLSQFAGYGYGTFKNELWRFDPNSAQWSTQPQSALRPAATFGSPNVTAVDVANGRLFLGQRSHGASGGNYDDLWMLELGSGTWSNLIAPSAGPDARMASALAFVQTTNELYRFGGLALDLSGVHGGLLRATPYAAAVAWEQVDVRGVEPSARRSAGLFFDSPRNRLVLVSGVALTWQDDVWAYALH